MHFIDPVLPPEAELLSPRSLRVGDVYYWVGYLDDERLCARMAAGEW